MLIVQIIVTILYVIFNQYIVTPVMYALHPAYAQVLTPILFGNLIIFLLDNIGFFMFIALAIWIWKGLQNQQTQTQYTYGAGGQ